MIVCKVINGIQTGAYKNIFNPENFYIGKQGIGAGNNWAAGYAAGETVQEEVFDMIDREADGSDSLEVRRTLFESIGSSMEGESAAWELRTKIDALGLHAPTFDCRGNWIWTWEFHPRTDERPIPEEADTDLFGLPRYGGCGRKSL